MESRAARPSFGVEVGPESEGGGGGSGGVWAGVCGEGREEEGECAGVGREGWGEESVGAGECCEEEDEGRWLSTQMLWE